MINTERRPPQEGSIAVLRTRITKLFNIKYPIICGGMYWIGRAELIAAVANAGGLGFMTAASFDSLDDLRAEIRKARDLTDGPVGLNINLFPALRPQPIEAWVEIACEEKIPVVETSGRSPETIVAPLHAGGVKIMHKVPGVKYARTVERLGCDAVCVVGHECGGHPGMDEVTTLVMVPATVDAVSIPVVAGGRSGPGRRGRPHGHPLHGHEGVPRPPPLEGVAGQRLRDGHRLHHAIH